MMTQSYNGQDIEDEVLKYSKIVFSTLSTSGQKRLESMGKINSLIVDEAGQSVEAETLIPLQWGPKKCLLIGDIKQLPATVISQDAKELKFSRSLMERLINDCKQPYSMLDTQYRMNPEISRFPNSKYYGGQLKNAALVARPEYQINYLSKYSFTHVAGQESKGPSQSFTNLNEVSAIAWHIQTLAQMNINIQSQVSIITFYKDQADLIYQNLKNKYPNIKVKTVDSFQGGESDIVMISFVRSNPQGIIGFVKDPNRLNVALTRAKYSLMMFGNMQTLERSKLKPLIKDAKKRNAVLTPTIPNMNVKR